MKKGIILSIFLISFCAAIIGQVQLPYIKYSYPDLKTYSNNAKLLHCKYFSQIWKKEIGYLIYLPKDYYAKPDTIFPIIFYLQGYGGNYTEPGVKFDRWNEAMDLYFPQCVIVTANSIENNFYEDDVEKTIIQELIPHIINTYRVSDVNGCTAIAGASMGGHGAVKFGLKYSQMFSMALSIAGGHFADVSNYIKEYKENGTGNLAIRAFIGLQDNIALEDTRYLKSQLTAGEIPFTYKEYNGLTHDTPPPFNDSVIRTETFTWMVDNFKRTCPVTLRNSTLPLFTEKELPYVDEYNPFGATPKPVVAFNVTRDTVKGLYLSWLKNFNPPDYYIIQRSINRESKYVTVDTVKPEFNWYKDSIDVSCNTKYDYRIIANNMYGISTPTYFSEARFFCTSIDKVQNINSLEIFPNPAKEFFTIKLQPEIIGKKLKVELHDIFGKKVNVALERINNQINVNSKELKGIYILSVGCGDRVIGRKKVVLKN